MCIWEHSNPYELAETSFYHQSLYKHAKYHTFTDINYTLYKLSNFVNLTPWDQEKTSKISKDSNIELKKLKEFRFPMQT